MRASAPVETLAERPLVRVMGRVAYRRSPVGVVLVTPQGSIYNQWQGRIMYHHWKKQRARDGPLNATVDNLDPHTTYAARVAAVNEDGTYDRSERMHLRRGVAWSGPEGRFGPYQHLRAWYLRLREREAYAKCVVAPTESRS